MKITDYAIRLSGEPLEKRLKIRKVLNNHNHQYCFNTPSAETLTLIDSHLAYSMNRLYGVGWESFPFAGTKTEISLDDFLLKFSRPLQTKRRR